MQTLHFDNQFTAALPADPVLENERRQISHAIYAHVSPTPVANPKLVAFSKEAAELIGLTEQQCNSTEFLQTFSGNKQHPDMQPHATCYGGHQFGNWAGQLGDGRAINLGEVNYADQHWMLQLKGAGPTPFSRTADGLAVMRSSVREFLCSEAMFHLGISTTRALSLVNTGEQVMRDMLYDGNPGLEPGAVVCRLSHSFIRFGHFQILTARGELDLLKTLTNFVIQRDFPQLIGEGGITTQTYIDFFREVSERTANLMVHWMRVGFVHGVMNTDNMSILGETIDYGPYGWLENFDPDWTPNTTDAANRRYRYSQQPAIGQWNLLQLANALLPLIDDPGPLEEILTTYASSYQSQWQNMMASKLGLNQFSETLVDELFNLLRTHEFDMTLFFRTLGEVDLTTRAQACEQLRSTSYLMNDQTTDQTSDENPPALQHLNNWLDLYQAELTEQEVANEQRRSRMHAVNPKYVLRNYLAQLAIDDAEQGDFSRVQELLQVLRQPYEDQPEYAAYAAMRPDWARTRVGCSMLSCSS